MKDNKNTALPFFGLPKLLPRVKQHKGLFLLMVLTGLYGSVVDIVLPLFQRYAINVYVADSTLKGLWIFITLFFITLVSQVVANYYSALTACKIEMYVGRDLKRDLFNHLQTLSFSFYNQNSVGYIHARVMSDTDRIASLCSWSLFEFVYSIVYVVGALIAMFIMSPPLAVLVSLVVPVLVILSAYFQKKLVVLQRQVREINSMITSHFNEGITGASTIKTLAAGETMERDFYTSTTDMRKKSVLSAHYRGLFMSTTLFAASFALAFVLWRGGALTESGLMLIGTLSAFMTYARDLTEPITCIIEDISSLITVQVNVERCTRLLETESDVRDTPEVIARYGDTFSPKKENWEELKGDIEFRDVTFRYPDGSENVLEHFNLHVPQGTTVAIVGETGAGKSTLVNLVCRFFEPTGGQILIDGRDVKERSQQWLHSNIGYVLQTPHLFSGTVLENLRYGNPGATMEQIKAAVKAVSADAVIARLPQGYESEVGEGGCSLSTGEKQLLSFARALLADPAIFVLDEATSSVDTETEQLIQNAIEETLRGRTAFIIAHRLSTIRRADIILVVDNGKIIERGTHKELMQHKGAYYALYSRQYREDMIRDSFKES